MPVSVREGEEEDTPGAHESHCRPLRTQWTLIEQVLLACFHHLHTKTAADKLPGQGAQPTRPAAGHAFL